jgi:hypothetical protein
MNEKKKPVKLPSESKIRALRDKIFIIPTSDKNWEDCKSKWMTEESVKWLQEKSAINLPPL